MHHRPYDLRGRNPVPGGPGLLGRASEALWKGGYREQREEGRCALGFVGLST
jgi:hypothetical protein